MPETKACFKVGVGAGAAFFYPDPSPSPTLKQVILSLTQDNPNFHCI